MILQSQEKEKERRPVSRVRVLFIPSASLSLSVYLHSAPTTVLIQKVSRINQLALAQRDTTLSASLRQLGAKVKRRSANSAGRATNQTRQKTLSAETSPTRDNNKDTESITNRLWNLVKKLNVTTAELKLQQCGNKRDEEEVEQMKKSLWS